MIDVEFQNALAFYQAPPDNWYDEMADKMQAAGEWLWGTLQGDFNEEQSAGQIVTGTVISMIPLVDQLCDVRDLIANCKKIQSDDSNTWSWVCLGLTLVGCFPELGSLVKGSAKVAFLSMRKAHFEALQKAGGYSKLLDKSVTQLNRYLDTPAAKAFMRLNRIYNPYHYLEGKIRDLMSTLSPAWLLRIMDELMKVTRSLFDTVTDWGPASLKRPVAEMWDTLMAVRNKANRMLAKALQPLTDLLDRLANRLRVEGDNAFRAHVGENTHLYGGARADKEITLFESEKPDWVDVGKKEKKYRALEEFEYQSEVSEGWPDISPKSKNKALRGKFDTFDNSMAAVEIPPGTVLYRVVDPASRDNSICWMRKEEFDLLKSKSEWRRRFAVWKSWNENGEFLTYTVPPGQPLKVWEGRAATQINETATEYSLEGGAVQIVLDPSHLKKEYTGPRQKTGWGYGDIDSDPAYPYQGLPKLETTHSWYVPEDKK